MRTEHMKLGVILDGIGGANWSWRRPEVNVRASIEIQNYIAEARRAETAKLDFVFIADTLHIEASAPPHYLNRLEPLTMLGAVAAATSRIGLIATVTTSYTEPFTVARQLASLDHISGGRAGWNVVTTALEGAAFNHSRETHLNIKDRYRRALEHVQVVRGLWDSWEDDAFVRNKETGVFFRPEKLHRLMHKGEFFRVDGPLNISRSQQGHPVLFQAGASEGGRDLAARTADAIFGAPRTIDEAKEYNLDVKRRAVSLGRAAKDLLFLPSINPIVAETDDEAERKYEAVCNLVSYPEALDWVSFFFSYHDFKQYEPDAPFPELGEIGHEAYRSVSDSIKRVAKEGNLTLRQVARKFAVPRSEFIGNADKVADACERWFQEGAVDGFILGGLSARFEDFLDLVVPRLRKRGLFRSEYESETLRGNLGLRAVPNQYASNEWSMNSAT